MRLLRYGPPGAEKPGMLDDSGGVRDLSAEVHDIVGEALTPQGVERLRRLDPQRLPLVNGVPQQDLRLGPCVGNVGKFIAIGLNYVDHAAESGMPIPDEPIVFNKWTSCICGPDDDVVIPEGSTRIDWELELGIVIGAGGHRIAEDEALSRVAGWCIVNDVSERDWQLQRGGTWDKGKGFDTFGPIGPWLVTTDEVPDPGNLGMWLDVNGERMQQGSTANMIFGAAQLVSYCSQFTTLHPGDIITTGTPAGVGLGKKPPRFLTEGEVMRLGIDGLGTQTQRVRRA